MYKRIVTHLFYKAKIIINGQERSDIQIKNENFYKRVLFNGSPGIGESYMDGWWECKAIDELIYKILKANLDRKIFSFDLDYDKILMSWFKRFHKYWMDKFKKEIIFIIYYPVLEHLEQGISIYGRLLCKKMV